MSTDFPKPEKKLFETKVTAVESTDIEGVGNVRRVIDGAEYRWVKNKSSTTALVANAAVCYHLATGAKLLNAVFTPATANLNAFAGKTMAAIPASEYGWIQSQGYADKLLMKQPKTTTTIAAGAIVKPSNGLTYPVFDHATTPTRPGFAVALEAIATASAAGTTTIKALIRGVL